MICAVVAEHVITDDNALTTDKVTVAVHVPVAIDIVDGIVIVTPAPVPNGLLIVIEKL